MYLGDGERLLAFVGDLAGDAEFVAENDGVVVSHGVLDAYGGRLQLFVEYLLARCGDQREGDDGYQDLLHDQ